MKPQISTLVLVLEITQNKYERSSLSNNIANHKGRKLSRISTNVKTKHQKLQQNTKTSTKHQPRLQYNSIKTPKEDS